MRQTERARRSRRAAANEFGSWLDRIQYEEGQLEVPWQYWSTLTFEKELTERGTRRAIEAHLGRLDVSRAFWGMEAGKVNGRLHGHALYRFNQFIPPSAEAIWRDWFDRHGRAHVDEFDQEKGATHYVSKYVSKSLSDYDLQGVDVGGLG